MSQTLSHFLTFEAFEIARHDEQRCDGSKDDRDNKDSFHLRVSSPGKCRRGSPSLWVRDIELAQQMQDEG